MDFAVTTNDSILYGISYSILLFLAASARYQRQALLQSLIARCHAATHNAVDPQVF
jgi:hypothetical protein